MHRSRILGCRMMCGAVMALAMVFVFAVASSYAIELTPKASIVVTAPKTSARGIDMSPDESALYIGGIQDRSLVKVTLSTSATTKVALTDINAGAYGKAAWVDTLGRVWAPLTIPVLAVYSADLKLEAAYDLKPFGLSAVEGALVAPNGDVYVTERGKAKPGVYKFRIENGQLVPVTSWGSNGYVELTELRVPILTPSGDLLMSVWGTGEVWLVKAADGVKSVQYKGINGPFYLDTDNLGRLWVAHYDKKEAAVSVYNQDGSLLRSWTAAELGTTTEIAGIAVTKDGKRLYVVDQRPAAGGSVLVFDVQ